MVGILLNDELKTAQNDSKNYLFKKLETSCCVHFLIAYILNKIFFKF